MAVKPQEKRHKNRDQGENDPATLTIACITAGVKNPQKELLRGTLRFRERRISKAGVQELDYANECSSVGLEVLRMHLEARFGTEKGYLADVANYPVLMNTGISVAIGYLNPCGLDSIHLHNRATETVILVAGKSLKTGFVLEDGFDLPVYTTIGLYQGTIRPQSSLHWEFNDNCVPAVFVASLSSEDPGVSRTAQNFFINPQEIVDADLAYPSWLDKVNTTDYRAQLPAAFARGAKECHMRCGLAYDTDQAGGISK